MLGLPRLARAAALGLAPVVLLGSVSLTAMSTASAAPAAASSAPSAAAAVPAKRLTENTILRLQRTFNRLGLPWASPDGKLGPYTRNVLCAAREVLRKDDYGPNADLATVQARRKITEEDALKMLKRTELPTPRGYMVRGMNVNRTCQIAYWVDVDANGKKYYRDMFRVSTGSRVLYEKDGRTDFSTQPGTFSIQFAYDGWSNSSAYPLDAAECKEIGFNQVCGNLYRPIYFTSGGDALHGRTDAYASFLDYYPASHGCIRMRHKDIDKLWAAGFPSSGALVKVYGDWLGQ